MRSMLRSFLSLGAVALDFPASFFRPLCSLLPLLDATHSVPKWMPARPASGAAGDGFGCPYANYEWFSAYFLDGLIEFTQWNVTLTYVFENIFGPDTYQLMKDDDTSPSNTSKIDVRAKKIVLCHSLSAKSATPSWIEPVTFRRPA